MAFANVMGEVGAFMKTLLRQSIKGLLMSTVVWATACSQVGFSPSSKLDELSIPDGNQKETFNFNDDNTEAKVDVLFVVDNSASMMDEQAKLGSALSSFIGSLGKIDWQLGITTTDITDGPYGVKGSLIPMKGTSGKILTKNTPNFASAFEHTVYADVLETCNEADIPCPSSDERPLAAAVLAMQKKNTDNAGFFRSGADLAIVILSDEDEGSDGTDAIAAAAVIAAFHTVFGGGKTLSAYGIIVQPGNIACYTAQAANAGHYGTYAASLALLTGGVTGSICDADYGPALASIGNRVRDMVKSITLKYTPDQASVQLIMTPFDSSLTWTFENNQIIFNKPPTKGTRIDVVYLPKK